MQHGFLKGRTTLTQLIQTYHGILESIATGKEVDVIYLDLAKAFDKVSHADLSHKLANFGITGILNKWPRAIFPTVCNVWYLKEHQDSVLGPILFLLYINDMPSYRLQNSSIMLFSDDSKLYRVINNISDIISLQEDLTNLHRWSIDSSMTFYTTKCKVLNII